MSFPCRVCGNSELSFYYGEGNSQQYKYYKCPVCGLVNYDLELGLDQDQYAEEYFDTNDLDIQVNQYNEQTFRFIKKNLGTSGSVLEIGCGSGYLLNKLQQSGWTVMGMELSPMLASEVRKRLGINVIEADFMEYDMPVEERFDLVILRHVFEHLPDPLKAINKLGALAKDNGHIVMEFPNIEAPELKLKRMIWRMGLRKYKAERDRLPGHANEFCRNSFKYLLNKTGFKLIKWETYTLKPISNFLYKVFPIGSKARVLIQKKKP